MDKADVFVWVDRDDGAGAALAARSLKQRMKAETGEWFLVGPRTERFERLGYDLGMKLLARPDQLSGLGALAAAHGTSPLVILWSGAAVLTADWVPVQGSHGRLWEACPAAVMTRPDLAGPGAGGWFDYQALSSLDKTVLPLGQVKVVGPGEFDKAVHGAGWPFGPAVVILEKPAPRR